MRIIRISSRDVKSHFRRNSGYYYLFLISIIIAIVCAVIIVVLNDSFLSLLVSKNKILYSFINGTASLNGLFFDSFFKFCYPILIILFLGLNYYSCLLSYIFITYQFSIFIMTVSALINVYYFAGVMISVFLVIPINLIYFANLVFLCVVCLERSRYAKRTKYFKEGYNKHYFFKVVFCFFITIILSFVIAYIFPMILKSAIFSIY